MTGIHPFRAGEEQNNQVNESYLVAQQIKIQDHGRPYSIGHIVHDNSTSTILPCAGSVS